MSQNVRIDCLGSFCLSRIRLLSRYSVSKTENLHHRRFPDILSPAENIALFQLLKRVQKFFFFPFLDPTLFFPRTLLDFGLEFSASLFRSSFSPWMPLLEGSFSPSFSPSLSLSSSVSDGFRLPFSKMLTDWPPFFSRRTKKSSEKHAHTRFRTFNRNNFFFKFFLRNSIVDISLPISLTSFDL